MKKRVFLVTVYLVLIFFVPPALIPSSGYSAPLSSRVAELNSTAVKVGLSSPSRVSFLASRNRLTFLSPREVRLLSEGRFPIYSGGQEDYSPLATNEPVAIVLTLLILGVMVGFVSQDH